MRVMTFNVRGAYWSQDGENYWPKRAALNLAAIRRAAPDLIGFQELQQGNIDVYEAELAGYQRLLGPHYGNREPYEYPAIYWNPQRLHIHESGGFWLSETPEVHSGAWDTACIRSATWARFSTPDGASFIHANTHLDHISDQARLEGARLILRQLAERAGKLPVVITGDFNCDPGSQPYAAFMEQGLYDTFQAANEQDTAQPATFHGFRGRARRIEPDRSERIDWILARGLQTERCTIIRDEEPPRYPSDHYPVVADLSF